jgi:hypothetical protein
MRIKTAVSTIALLISVNFASAAVIQYDVKNVNRWSLLNGALVNPVPQAAFSSSFRVDTSDPNINFGNGTNLFTGNFGFFSGTMRESYSFASGTLPLGSLDSPYFQDSYAVLGLTGDMALNTSRGSWNLSTFMDTDPSNNEALLRSGLFLNLSYSNQFGVPGCVVTPQSSCTYSNLSQNYQGSFVFNTANAPSSLDQLSDIQPFTNSLIESFLNNIPQFAVNPTLSFVEESIQFAQSTNGNNVLRFSSLRGVASSLSAEVPEPGTIALMGIGLFSLMMLGRRRQGPILPR